MNLSQIIATIIHIFTSWHSIKHDNIICTNYLNDVNKDKTPSFYKKKVLNKIYKNALITLQKLTQLDECFISPCLTIVQIYKLHGYMQYKMHKILSMLSYKC